MNGALTPDFKQKIGQWQEKLAELGKSNRLLYFQKDKEDTTKIPLAPSEAFEKLVIKSESISLSGLEIEEIQADTIKRSLKKLQKKAKEVLREKGVNTLFVALGTLTWNSKKEPKEPIISPIILVPIELSKASNKEYELTLTDEAFFINPALLLRLKQDEINICDEIKTEENLVYDDIVNKFSQNQDIKKRINDGLWKIEEDEDIYIGLFERKKSSMIKDIEYLEKNKDSLLNHPILKGLANDKTAYESSLPEIIQARDLDNGVEPQSVFQILEADSSQQEVIEAAKAGMSLIVQGPPGTGKSQTIVNIITELIAQKKKVLLVAEKPVALQVVFDRLKQSNLEDICLNFSDKDVASKKNIAKYLKLTKSKLEGRDEEQESEDL